MNVLINMKQLKKKYSLATETLNTLLFNIDMYTHKNIIYKYLCINNVSSFYSA